MYIFHVFNLIFECLSICYLGYKNHKSCKILPKFLPTLHSLQESYKIVQKPQILQICYNVEHFLQESDNIFANKFLQKMRCVFRPESQKSANCQKQQPQLPFTMHRLSQGPSKKVKMVNFD